MTDPNYAGPSPSPARALYKLRVELGELREEVARLRVRNAKLSAIVEGVHKLTDIVLNESEGIK